MKKLFSKLTRLACLLLTFVMSFSFIACAGTGNEGEEDTTTNNQASSENTYIDTEDYESTVPEGVEEFGTHDYTAPMIEDKWLVKDGATLYTLVVPATTVEADKTAFNNSKREFLKFFEQATGIVLDVKIDTSLPVQTHSADQHYISLGKTTLLTSLGDTVDYSKEEVEALGGKIKTVDNNIYLMGYTDQGVLNMVYTFLTITFNWETYSANTVVIDENVTDLNLFDYDVFDIPDIGYSATSGYEKDEFPVNHVYGYNYPHPTEGGYYYGTRVRVAGDISFAPYHIFEGTPEELYNDPARKAQLSVCSGHNSLNFMQRTVYESLHPDWYDEKGVQLCYSAHGDEEEFELMTTYAANAYILTYMNYPVEKYPHQRLTHISCSDNMNMCTCDTCKDYRVNQSFNDSGILIRWVNRVAEKIRDWMQKPENERWRRDDFLIQTSAYYANEAPPAQINPDTGEWEPVSTEVVLGPNTNIKWAPIDADFQQSLFVADNKVTKDTFDGWVSVANGNIGYFMYNYNCNYHNYFYDGFDFYNTQVMNYIFARGDKQYYSENLHGNVPTEFGALISYVNAKLCYDSTLDSGKLIRNWFKAVYGSASGIMMDFFTELRVFNSLETTRIGKNGGRTNRNGVRDLFNWRLPTIQGWISKIDTALRIIEPLKRTNPEEWSRIAYNIELEVFSSIYIIYDQALNISPEVMRGYVNRIKDNVERWPEYRYVDKISVLTSI